MEFNRRKRQFLCNILVLHFFGIINLKCSVILLHQHFPTLCNVPTSKLYFSNKAVPHGLRDMHCIINGISLVKCPGGTPYTLQSSVPGSYKNLQPFFKDFSRTTLDFQGPPTRNIISQIVRKCTFPVYSNKTLRLELFTSPTSLLFSVHWS